MLEKQSLGEKEIKFRKDALAFLINFLLKHENVFHFHKKVLSQLRILDVGEALSNEGRLKSIVRLASQITISQFSS